MSRATVNDVESKSYRYMEWALMTPLASLVLAALPFVLFGGLIAWAGGTSGSVTSSEDGAAGLVGVAVVGFIGPTLLFGLAIVLFSVGALAIVITVYTDAKTLETADIGWQPNPTVFGLVTFFFQPFALYYLYERHEHVVDWVDTGRWNAVAAGSLVISTLFVVTGLLSQILGQVGLPLVLVSLGAIALAPFPYAIYRDSTYVRLNSGAWQPNPGLTLSAAFTSMFLLPPTYLLFGGWYLYKRKQAI